MISIEKEIEYFKVWLDYHIDWFNYPKSWYKNEIKVKADDSLYIVMTETFEEFLFNINRTLLFKKSITTGDFIDFKNYMRYAKII